MLDLSLGQFPPSPALPRPMLAARRLGSPTVSTGEYK